MKSKFFTLFAAFTLLFGAKAMAQTNGDVNGDGKTDEQDITAIIQIMQEAGGVKEPTKYYWYVGQTNPAEMTSIEPIVTDNSSPGWRYIGTSIPTYSSTKMLWNGDSNNITFAARDFYYIAVPNNEIKLYNVLGGSEMADVTISEHTINGVKYYVYTSTVKGRTFTLNLY